MTWLWIVLGILAGLILLTVGFSYFMFHFIFYRPKRSTKVPKAYVGTPHYKVSRAGMEFMKTLPCEDWYLTSRDGLRLHAYYFPAKEETKKIVLGIHGYKSYARPEYGPYIEYYRSLGYGMVLPDDRAHAPSEGKYIGFGVLDRLDCVDWAKEIVSRFGEDVEILLHGVSMGSATVLAASGEDDLPKQVKGIVADCGFSSAWEALSHELKAMAHIPAKPFLNICERICRHRAGFDFHNYSALEQVRKSKTPTLFVQGGKDVMVPAYMVHQLYDACAAEKRLFFVEEAGHAESIAVDPIGYHRSIEEFFHLEHPDAENCEISHS